MFPNGYDEIVAEYGNPKLFLRGDGTVHSAAWEGATLGPCTLPEPITLGWDEDVKVSRIRVHRKLIVPLMRVFEEIHRSGFWPLLKTFDGCYSWRAKRGVSKLSAHCWGIALDFNAETNQLGEDGDMPLEIVNTFVKHGWEWGGRWPRKDAMHFQACHNY